jgi:hypothetical protein
MEGRDNITIANTIRNGMEERGYSRKSIRIRTDVAPATMDGYNAGFRIKIMGENNGQRTLNNAQLEPNRMLHKKIYTIQCKKEKKASRKTTTPHHSAIATSFSSFTAAASTSLMLCYE